MPSYRTHATVNLAIALPALMLSSIYLLSLAPALVAVGAGCFTYGTLFMNPDLDMARQIRLLSLRGILALPFRTYALVFRHRGLSHSLLLGTTTRLLWLGLYALVGFYLIHQVVPTKQTFMQFFHAHQPYLLVGFGGLFLADACHVLLDKWKS